MNARFSKLFAKQLGKYPAKIQAAFQARLGLFLNNPYYARLNNHPLTGQWEGFRSINISGDLRAIFELIDPQTAYFVAFGSHSQLYG